MDHTTTQIIDGGDRPQFTPDAKGAAGVELLWARDGKGPPGPGGSGDVLLVTEDLFSRTFRARGPAGEPFLVEIQRDHLDSARLPRMWQPFSNEVIEAIWRRAATAAGAAAKVGLPWMGFMAYPTLVVCKEKAKIFNPPSPETGRADTLDDCRDDELLEKLRLPLWNDSIERLLYDPSAARTSARPRFYTASRRPPRDAEVPVGTWDDFVRELGRLVDPRATVDPTLGTLNERFPCLKCDQSMRCFPVPGMSPPGASALARQRLAAVAFHPFHAIAHREERMSYAEHVDLLGGATWQAFRSRNVSQWPHAGRRLARETLEHTAFARVAPVSPVDAVSAKLALFQAVVEAVQAYHRTHGQPHLGLSTTSIVSHSVFVGAEESHQVELRAGLRAARLEDVLDCPGGVPIWLPPPGAEAPYAHRDILRAIEPEPVDGVEPTDGFRFGWPQAVRVTIGRVWDDPAQGTVECEVNLAGGGLASISLEPNDLVCVTIDGPGWEEHALWCRADPERALQDIETMPLRAFATVLSSGNVMDLRGASTGRALFGSATCYRSYGAFYDIHALGILLLHTLLDNADHRIDDVARDVLPSLVSISKAVSAGGGEAEAWEQLIGVLESMVQAAPLDVYLSDANASFFPGEVSAAAQRVPGKLWAELLAIVVSCVTRTRGMALCESSRLETDAERFSAPIERLLKRVKTVRRSLPMPELRHAGAAPAQRPAAPGQAAVAAPAGPDPQEEIRRLKDELRSKAAHIQRLESELTSAIHAREDAERRPGRQAAPAVDDGARLAWFEVMDALAGATRGTYPAPRPGDPTLELVKTIVVDGLGTLSVLLSAVAELGGQEFANEQRDLSRVVRAALTKVSRDDPTAAEAVKSAIRDVRRTRSTLGGVIGLLVDAHGRSTRDGSANLMRTLEFAMRNELGLKGSQLRDLEGILGRIQANLGELVARLYDPVFQRHVQKGLAQGGR